MITKNIKELNQPCEPCSSVNEGEEIAAKLIKELTISKNGIGLAANQIGIQKRVCVINVKEEPVVLINPKKHLYFLRVVYLFQINMLEQKEMLR